MSRPTINDFTLWATQVAVIEYAQDECAAHNQELVQLVLDETGFYTKPDLGPDYEIRLPNLDKYANESVAWLVNSITYACRAYLDMPDARIDVGLRAVVLRNGMHINTHTESHESDLTVAYWPSGNVDDAGSQVSRQVDRTTAPAFIIEDPSRHLTDLRLPWETRHSVTIAPRPGMMVIGPNHLPHNMWPYLGDAPFIHIVAQIKVEWPEGYDERW